MRTRSKGLGMSQSLLVGLMPTIWYVTSTMVGIEEKGLDAGVVMMEDDDGVQATESEVWLCCVVVGDGVVDIASLPR